MSIAKELSIEFIRSSQAFKIDSCRYCARIQQWMIVVDPGEHVDVLPGDEVVFLGTEFVVLSCIHEGFEFVIDLRYKEEEK